MENVSLATASLGSHYVGFDTPGLVFSRAISLGPVRRGSSAILPLSSAAPLLPCGHQSFLPLGSLGTDPV